MLRTRHMHTAVRASVAPFTSCVDTPVASNFSSYSLQQEDLVRSIVHVKLSPSMKAAEQWSGNKATYCPKSSWPIMPMNPMSSSASACAACRVAKLFATAAALPPETLCDKFGRSSGPTPQHQTSKWLVGMPHWRLCTVHGLQKPLSRLVADRHTSARLHRGGCNGLVTGVDDDVHDGVSDAQHPPPPATGGHASGTAPGRPPHLRAATPAHRLKPLQAVPSLPSAGVVVAPQLIIVKSRDQLRARPPSSTAHLPSHVRLQRAMAAAVFRGLRTRQGRESAAQLGVSLPTHAGPP